MNVGAKVIYFRKEILIFVCSPDTFDGGNQKTQSDMLHSILSYANPALFEVLKKRWSRGRKVKTDDR